MTDGAWADVRRWPARLILAGFVLAAIVLLVVFESLPIDLHVQRALFDPALGDFRLHHDPRLQYWLHVQARRALYVFPAFAALCWLDSTLIARRAADASRRAVAASRARRGRYVLVALLVAPTMVSLAKQLTDRPCPWDLAEFGGGVRHYGLFAPAPPGARPLACFPAGHASGGFALLAFALAAGAAPAGVGAAGARRRRALVLGWFVLSVAVGALLGTVRVVQGAHFVSHVLWSAWLVWLVQWLLARWMLSPVRERGFAPNSAYEAGAVGVRQRSGPRVRPRARRVAEAWRSALRSATAASPMSPRCRSSTDVAPNAGSPRPAGRSSA